MLVTAQMNSQRVAPRGLTWKRVFSVLIVAAMALTLPSLGTVDAGHGAGTYVAPDPQFVDIADDAGLDFTCKHWHKGLGLAARWFIDVLFCASPVLADLNGDGYTDLFFPNMRYSYNSLNTAEAPRDGWFLNNGDGTFTDMTDYVNIADEGYSGGGAALDYDNDGDLDIMVVNFPNQAAWYPPIADQSFNSPATDFYVNNGDGTFTRSVPAGLTTETRFGKPDNQMGQAISVADYDGDGFLDVFRGNYIQYQLPQAMPAGLQLTEPDTNNLYRNNGDGTFTDKTMDAGVSPRVGRTFGSNFVDFNGDMLPDLYVANDENRNEVYLNNGDGTFLDQSFASGADDPRGSMCSETADWNNDGALDLYMSNYENEFNGYYLGNGDGTWNQDSELGDLGISYEILGWGCPALDFDNDGDLDLFVANGHMLPIGGQFPGGDDGYELPNFLFRNTLRETGVHSFEDIRAFGGPGLADRYASSGAMPLDIDLDGTLEIIVVENNDQPSRLYKNTAPDEGHWLSVTLDSGTANRFAIGAKVVVEAGTLTQTRFMMTGNTLASGSVAPMHFGLGDEGGPVTVHVTWPGGATQSVVTDVDRPVRIHKTAGLQIDTLAPAVDVSVAGVLGENGWYTSSTLDITMEAFERGIAAQGTVTELSYSLDGGPLTPYTGAVSVSGEGEHRMAVFAADSNGNRAWYPHMFRIDSQAPDCAVAEPLVGKVYVQGRLVGDSADGQTYIVAPVQTPDNWAEKTDFLIEETGEYLSEYWLGDFPIPGAPMSLGALLADTVGSPDGRTPVYVESQDATSGVRELTFFFDGTQRAADTAAPFAWRADLRGQTVGAHTLTIVASDHAGNALSADIVLNIVPTTQDGALNTAMALVGGL